MGNTAKFHPLTGAQIVPLGYRKNGRAIWPIMGGDDSVPPGTPPADSPPADAPPADTPPKADTPPADDGKGGKDAILADLTKERGKRQGLEAEVQNLKDSQQQQLDAIAKALGLQPDDQPADPAKLTADITTAQADAREARQQLAVYRNAAANEANPDALLDSASFLRSIKDVDPTDAAAVNAAIKAAVEGNPGFKAVAPTPIPPTFGGGPRTPAGHPDPGPGLPRLAAAYAENSK